VEKSFSQLVSAMSRRDFYPHLPEVVETRQTHISCVFLTGPYVYKIKKPVRLPFVDYSTLARRRHFCHEEIRLNRRLAPGIYLEVVPIIKREKSFLLAEGLFANHDSAIEYAVKMKRLSDERLLSTCVQSDSVRSDDIRTVAKTVARFHAGASTEKAGKFGSAEAIGARVRANFQETEPFINRTISRSLFEKIRLYSEEFLRENHDGLRARVMQKRVREGHGDLRAEHVCLLKEPIIFDCIEFDEGLRYGDNAAEIGFLSMDLDYLAASRLSRKLEETYAAEANDEEIFSLLPFYKCYRAYVRGKVASLKSQEEEVAETEKSKAAIEAQRYFCLSSRYTRRNIPRLLVAVCGLVGTGKSTVAGMLSDLSGFPTVSSDRVRKKLAGLAPTVRSRQDYRSGIYSEEFDQFTYEGIWSEAEKQLASGPGIIVDATFKDAKHRSRLVELGDAAAVPVYFVECQANERTVRRRLRERAKSADHVSDADWQVYQRMRREFQPLSEISEDRHLRIDTETEFLSGLDRLARLFDR
jgi:uncharacterized protein